MHEAVTNSSTKSYFPTTTDDLLSPINLTARPKSNDAVLWSQDSDSDAPIDNWHIAQPEDKTPSALAAALRTPSAAPPIQNLPFAHTMGSLSDKAPSNSDGSLNANTRWRFNTTGQLVDSEAPGGWDLADEIVRLNIGDVGDADDGSIRTPPNTKMAAATVAHLTETSPLDTASSASVDSSPHTSDHQIPMSHSRGSSTDTSASTHESAASKAMAPPPPLKGVSELKERPHSFSGGLSSADLRRLQFAGEGSGSDSADGQLQQQQQQWAAAQSQYREPAQANVEQLSYPSLANNAATVQRPSPQSQLYDYRNGGAAPNAANRDDLQIDYNIQARNFNPIIPQGPAAGTTAPTAPPFVPGRPNPGGAGMGYRQPRFPQQGLLPSPSLGYHSSHLSLGSSQQLYDMMLPGSENLNPAVSRVQQQHNVFRGTHHHSASDPSALRDAATMALLNNNMQGFAPGMFPPPIAAAPPPAMPMYPNQFYPTQDAYARPDGTAAAQAQAMAAARLQAQYTGPYGIVPPTGPIEAALSSPTSTNGGQNGPSANNRKLGLYKTELCRSWEEKGTCRYGAKCQFAHGEEELRKVARHPKYKTEICRTFWVSGSCPYGKRCCFIHTELPASGSAAVAGSAPTDNAPPPTHGRTRSLSTNSDPNEASVSLLARISAKRGQESSGSNSSSTPVEVSPTANFQFAPNPRGPLRVDTSTLDTSLKQNKSAYPSFASNGVLLPAPEQITAKSPAPVTAGPDLGRHNAARMEIVGYNQRVGKATTPPTNANPRHSFNGTEDISFSPSPPVSGQSYALSSGEGPANANQPARVNGHVRAGSAGNWGNNFSRNSSNLTAAPYTHGTNQGDMITSPWSTTELAMGSSRLNEKAWA